MLMPSLEVCYLWVTSLYQADCIPSTDRILFFFLNDCHVSLVSLAASKAGAAARKIPLWKHFAEIAGNPTPDVMPVPCFNVINGGEHAGNRLAFQEFFVIPTGASTFSESMQIGCEVFHNLKAVIKKKFGGDATLIGDEGGFAPPCDVESGLQLIMEATEKAGYLDKVSVGLDVAASEFKVKGQNQYDLDFVSFLLLLF